MEDSLIKNILLLILFYTCIGLELTFPCKYTILFSPIVNIIFIIYIYKNEIITYDFNNIKNAKTLEYIIQTILAGVILQGFGNFIVQYIFHIHAPDLRFAFGLTAASVTSTLLSSINEEIVFRRIIFKYLDNKFGFIIGSTVSSLIFMFSHYNYAGWLGYFLIAMVWSYFYKKTNSIVVVIAAHMVTNYFMFLSYSLQFN